MSPSDFTTALSTAALPAVVGLAALGLAYRGLARAWPDHLSGGPHAFWIPAASVTLALVALSGPRYAHPDVQAHARCVLALGADPYLAFDPSGPSEPGALRPSAVHLLAWPFVRVLGEVAAVRTVGVVAFGLSLLLVHALARGVGLGPHGGLLAQALAAVLPVHASRLTLALYPALLGETLELLLLVHLVRRFPHLDGARDAGAAAVFFALAGQIGSPWTVGALAGIFGLIEIVDGDRRRALRLLAALGLAMGVVIGARYGRFLLTHGPGALVGWILAGASSASPAGGIPGAIDRLRAFYDLVYPLLLLPGLVALRGAPAHARRLLAAALLGGGVYDIEFVAAPVAVASAAGLRWLSGGGGWRRGAALAAGLVAAAWGVSRALELYGGWTSGR